MKHLRSLLKNIADGGTVHNGNGRSFEADFSRALDYQNSGLTIDESESFFLLLLKELVMASLLLAETIILSPQTPGILSRLKGLKKK
jgi:hypothetical protein